MCVCVVVVVGGGGWRGGIMMITSLLVHSNHRLEYTYIIFYMFFLNHGVLVINCSESFALCKVTLGDPFPLGLFHDIHADGQGMPE